jgi:hypothetical protein
MATQAHTTHAPLTPAQLAALATRPDPALPYANWAATVQEAAAVVWKHVCEAELENAGVCVTFELNDECVQNDDQWEVRVVMAFTCTLDGASIKDGEIDDFYEDTRDVISEIKDYRRNAAAWLQAWQAVVGPWHVHA